LDKDVPSLKKDLTTDESWMIDKTWKNEKIDKKANVL
jgi:hypothetical protein